MTSFSIDVVTNQHSSLVGSNTQPERFLYSYVISGGADGIWVEHYMYLYFNRNRHLLPAEYEEIFKRNGNGSITDIVIKQEQPPFDGSGICGGAAMSQANVFDIVANLQKSKELHDKGQTENVWTCIYYSNLFNQATQLEEFNSLFVLGAKIPEASNYYNKILLPEFCGAQHIATTSEPCQDGQDTCSIFLALSQNGDYCRRWEDTAVKNGEEENLNIIDSVKNQYCQKYPYEKDCTCLTRTLNPYYYITRVPYPDYCYFTPCLTPSQYLTSHRDASIAQDDQTCKNACATIINLFTDGKAVFTDEFSLYIDCDFTSLEENQPKPPEPQPNEPIEEVGFWDEYKWIIIGVSIAVVIIIIIIIIVASVTIKNK